MNSTIKEIAEREGPQATEMLRFIDCSADFRNGNQFVLMSLVYRQNQFWERKIKMSESDMYTMKEDFFVNTISDAMRGTLSLAGQIEQTRLEKMFPNSIKNVLVTYDHQKAEKVFQVVFKNGHMAEGYESEVHTDYFSAKCTMLYDLPPL